jgi:hypothetical protein
MPKRPVGNPAASGRAEIKHFVLSIKKKVKLIMKLEKNASMKQLHAVFGAGTSTTCGLEPKT